MIAESCLGITGILVPAELHARFIEFYYVLIALVVNFIAENCAGDTGHQVAENKFTYAGMIGLGFHKIPLTAMIDPHHIGTLSVHFRVCFINCRLTHFSQQLDVLIRDNGFEDEVSVFFKLINFFFWYFDGGGLHIN